MGAGPAERRDEAIKTEAPAGRPRLKLIAALCVALAFLGPGAPNAGADFATLVPCVGVQFHAGWSDYNNAQRLEVLDTLAAAGADWIRIDMGWASLQPQRGRFAQWYVDRLDFTVDAAVERGLKVLGTLWWTPSWANGGGGRAEPPDEAADFGRIAGWAAGHFRGRVQAWEIWNEPNLPDFFTGSSASYTRLLKAAYGPIKTADPGALVVSGGPAYNDVSWLKGLYAAGASGYFDVLATHPYMAPADLPPETQDNGTKWTLRRVEGVRALMERKGDASKPIWFTEFGWSAHPDEAGTETWRRGVSARTQADYLVRTIELVRNRYPFVTNLFWYTERNGSSGDPHLDNYGLLDHDLDPKPAYTALEDYMRGMQGLGRCTLEISNPLT